jgi:hypothetical protein
VVAETDDVAAPTPNNTTRVQGVVDYPSVRRRCWRKCVCEVEEGEMRASRTVPEKMRRVLAKASTTRATGGAIKSEDRLSKVGRNERVK